MMAKNRQLSKNPSQCMKSLKDHVSNCMTKKSNQLVTAELTGHCLFVNWFNHCGRGAVYYVARSKAEPIIQTPATSASVEKPKESSQAPESSTQSSTPPSSSSEPEKKTAVAVVSDANNQVTATVKDANSPINITFKGTEGSCWIGVMVDGNYTYQHTCTGGDPNNSFTRTPPTRH